MDNSTNIEAFTVLGKQNIINQGSSKVISESFSQNAVTDGDSFILEKSKKNINFNCSSAVLPADFSKGEFDLQYSSEINFEEYSIAEKEAFERKHYLENLKYKNFNAGDHGRIDPTTSSSTGVVSSINSTELLKSRSSKSRSSAVHSVLEFLGNNKISSTPALHKIVDDINEVDYDEVPEDLPVNRSLLANGI